MVTMKQCIAIYFLFTIFPNVIARSDPFTIAPGLTITPLTQNVYMHTFENSNGIIYVNNDEALLVSTPPSDEVTLQLIGWVEDSLNKKITGFVIDRWHPDAMEGLDVVHDKGIPTYASVLTRQIAREKDLPVPAVGFDTKMDVEVGNEIVYCHYFGPAHTLDGIVVYFPSESLLFGGNEVRNYKGWIGNIADAHLSEWSSTIRKVKQTYGNASVVVPGHGAVGGPELLDYTIALYQPFEGMEDAENNSFCRSVCPFFIDTFAQETGVLIDTLICFGNDKRSISIDSPVIEYSDFGRRIKSPEGYLCLVNKQSSSQSPGSYGYFRKLYIDFRDDAIEITIVLQELTPNFPDQ